MDGDIYIKDQHDGEEIRRAIRIAMPVVALDGPITFAPGSAAAFPVEWSDWLDGRWTPFLAKHVLEVCLKARAMEVREMLELDEALSDFLDADEAERSLAVGRAALESAQEARHHRIFDRFRQHIAEGGEQAGHAATVFAAHAAAYHVPLFPALVSYLNFEWRAGAASLAGDEAGFDASEAQFVKDAMGALGAIRALLEKHLGDLAPAACA